MNLKGRHSTRYTFSTPVTLGLHTVRLRPRSDGGQFLRRFDIQVDPQPSVRSDVLDAEGNGLVNLWFLGKTDHLHIETHFEIETLRVNPYDFVPAPDTTFPLKFSAEAQLLLNPALMNGFDPAVQVLAQQIADRCAGNVLDYVIRTNTWIYENILYEPREDGDPYNPCETLLLRGGACRDTAVLLMALCRAMGIPARFVSGYQNGGPDVEQHDLHAWAEVWIPGGGWRGFDPTLGLAVSDGHIAVAASVFSALTAPVSGGFYSNTTIARIPQHCIEISVG